MSSDTLRYDPFFNTFGLDTSCTPELLSTGETNTLSLVHCVVEDGNDKKDQKAMAAIRRELVKRASWKMGLVFKLSGQESGMWMSVVKFRYPYAQRTTVCLLYSLQVNVGETESGKVEGPWDFLVVTVADTEPSNMFWER